MSDHEPKRGVCDECGWYDHLIRDPKSGRVVLDETEQKCRPKAGQLADRLFAAAPEAQAAKLGWGTGRVAIGVLDDFQLTIQLWVADDYFRVEKIGVHGPALSVEDAADLTRSLLAWHERREQRRRATGGGS